MRRDVIFVNRASSVPLHRQLGNAIREAIVSGVLNPGERMLSSRELQTHLGVSRNTVTEAFDQLESEGYVLTRRGIGTFVASGIARSRNRRTRCAAPVTLSKQALEFIAVSRNEVVETGGLAFRAGIPALDSFPLVQFRSCLRAEDWSGELLDYPQRAGLQTLRSSIATRLRQTRGVACTPDQVFITTGAQAAFALLYRILLREGDSAIVEDPCYPNALSILQSSGAKIVPVPVDDDGIRVDEFPAISAKLVYLTPSHQYPTGALLTLHRRIQILDWAIRKNAWIVEDDYDSEFNYSGRVHPTLQGLDENQRVIYVGSFSKTLAPALRIAYVVLPEALCDAFGAAHEITGAAPSIPIQAALARFIDGGHLGRHISKMRKVYNERRQFVSARLSGASGSPFTIRDSAAGLHFIAELPSRVNDVIAASEAAACGIVTRALSPYYLRKPSMNGLVIGYAATPLPVAAEAIEILLNRLPSLK